MVRKGDDYPMWIREEAGRSDPTMIVQAGIVIGKFDARPWLSPTYPSDGRGENSSRHNSFATTPAGASRWTAERKRA